MYLKMAFSQTQDTLYHLNVCGPLNPVALRYGCPEGGLGACQTSLLRDRPFSLGLATSDPVVNGDETIIILYTGEVFFL